MASASRWSDELIFKFIRLYRERPCLWRSDSPEYKCKALRQEALRSIVEQMQLDGFDANTCRLKIKNLRSHYCQELKKIRYSRETRSAEYKPSLAWFPLLNAFLRQYVHQTADPHENVLSFSGSEIEADDSEMKLCDRDEPEESVDVNDFGHEAIPDVVIKQEEVEDGDDDDDVEGSPRRQLDESGKSSSAYRKLRKVKKFRPYRYAMEKPETEFDIFCRSVALQLNNMPLENALRLQHNIQNLVTEERLSCLQNQQRQRQS